MEYMIIWITIKMMKMKTRNILFTGLVSVAALLSSCNDFQEISIQSRMAFLISSKSWIKRDRLFLVQHCGMATQAMDCFRALLVRGVAIRVIVRYVFCFHVVCIIFIYFNNSLLSTASNIFICWIAIWLSFISRSRWVSPSSINTAFRLSIFDKQIS